MQNRDDERERDWNEGDSADYERGRAGYDREGGYANRGARGDYGRSGTAAQGYRRDWQGQTNDYDYGRGPAGQRSGQQWQERTGASGVMGGYDNVYGGPQYVPGGAFGDDRGQGRYGNTGYGTGTPMTSFTYVEYWLIPGPYTGRGPRGYQRNNERIREDVNHRLTQHGQIDASDIEVRVENGEVTLTGTVENRQQKRLAEDITEDVPGVRDVHNELKVRGSFIDKVKEALSPGDTSATGTQDARTREETPTGTTQRRDIQ